LELNTTLKIQRVSLTCRGGLWAARDKYNGNSNSGYIFLDVDRTASNGEEHSSSDLILAGPVGEAFMLPANKVKLRYNIQRV